MVCTFVHNKCMHTDFTFAPATRTERLARPLRAALQHPWVAAIVRESALEDTLQALHPLLSLKDVRARVVKRIAETADTLTLVLRPNALWRGARAGQFVGVTVEINGRRHQRMYSLTSRPSSRLIAITVQRQGLVSAHLHDHKAVGTVLTLSPAMGEFVLPQEPPPKLLLIGAGSGITPVMALLRELQASCYLGSVALLHLCRSPAEQIFAAELRSLQADLPGFRYVSHYSASQGRFDPRALASLLSDVTERAAWVCGPAALIDAVQAFWRSAGLSTALHSERFGAAPRVVVPLSQAVSVALVRGGQEFESLGTASLLDQAEAAGLAPKHGCRIGICRSCQCIKRSGTVQHLHTGELSSAPNELIRLCVSAARTDLSLEL